jgi:hypothetical protein
MMAREAGVVRGAAPAVGNMHDEGEIVRIGRPPITRVHQVRRQDN